MEQEYSTSTGFKIFYGASALALIIFSIFLFGSKSSNAAAFGFIPILVAGAIVFNLYKRKVIITDNSICYTSIWGTRELESSNVKGFKVEEKAIFIYPLQDGYPKIAIRDYLSIADDSGLKELLSRQYKDLNKIEYDEEKQEILKDYELGATQEDREDKFKTMSKYAMVYSFGGLGLFFAMLFFHGTNNLLSVIALLYPLTGIALIASSKGIIRLFAKKNSAHPSIFIGILCSAMVPAILSVIDAKVISYDNLWLPAGVIVSLLFIIFYLVAIKRANAPFLSQIVLVVLTPGIYGFGCTLLSNSLFDQSNPQVFSATVIDHHITNGKSTTYHVIIGGWGPHQDDENVTVSSAFYYQVAVGSTVKVNLKNGFFKIPWYYLSQ